MNFFNLNKNGITVYYNAYNYYFSIPLIGSTTYSFAGMSPITVNGLSNFATGFAALPARVVPCFKENTKILTNNGYKYVQNLRKGDLIKTLNNNYKPIYLIAKGEIIHNASQEKIKNQLYKCSQKHYPEIFEDLIMTGCHSILIDDYLTENEKSKTIEINGDTYVTEGKYRLPTCCDEKSEVYEVPGTYTIYHFTLENEDDFMNYGVYANGLLVESCPERNLKRLNMTLIE